MCIITARGGSKRVPRKNVRDFCGRPIIAYSIEAALGSGLFDEVMVSTDDAEIADVARSYGASVPFMRSAGTSGDFATTNEVLEEVLAEYGRSGRSFGVVCCLYPTAPFVTAADLIEASSVMEETGAGMVMPVAAFSYPPQRGYRITGGGELERVDHAYDSARSQDLEPVYHDAGQFYFMRAERLEAGEAAGPTVPLVRGAMRVQDIDNEDDWAIAEMKFRALSQGAAREGRVPGREGA